MRAGEPRASPGTDERTPLTVCLAPAAAPLIRSLLAGEVPAGMSVTTFTAEGTAPAGPSILVLAPDDLRGRSRDALLAVARAALPARPILFGGSASRDILLEAINIWRVFRVVPDTAIRDVLLDAVQKTYEAMQTEMRLEATEAGLREETRRLEETVAEVRRTQSQLVQDERLATVGRFTGGLIPVIREHLGALEDFERRMKSDLPADPRLQELLAYAFEGVRSLQALLDEIRGYAEKRPESCQLERQEIDPLVDFAVAFSRFDPLAADRVVGTTLSSRARVHGDRHRLHQMLMNLLRNAFQATPPRGRIEVRTFTDGSAAVIEVENPGEPIPDALKEKIFEPFFSTKGEGGTGLGLPMCRLAVEAHGGSITCEDVARGGTCFRVRLPALSS